MRWTGARPDELLVEAQEAALGASGRAWRLVVVASPDRERAGLVIGPDEAHPGEDTVAIDGPVFARRVELVAGDIIQDGERWRVELGVRGC